MQLVEKHIIKRTHKLFNELDELSFLSKNLYNRANYIIRQEFIKDEDNKYLNYYDINRMMIDNNNIDYRTFPAKVSNGILRLLDKNWKSFFKSIKDYSKNPNKYLGRPKIPRYKDTKTGRNIIPFEKGAISKTELRKNSLISLSKTNIKIPTKISFDELQAVRIVPRYDHYVIEVIYNKEIEDYELNQDNILGIDIGVNNLASISTTIGYTFIINGKPLKSINQYYNKVKSNLQSKLERNRFKSNRINKLTNKRNNKVNDYLHKSSRYIIDYCLTHNIGKIVIGNNKNWKQNIKIGKRNNQNFVAIPFVKFIDMIKYKARLVSIEVIITEESYTSKCSFVDNEDVKKHQDYLGKRIKRGLFKSFNGSLINADINGSFNIIRKVVPLFNFNSLKYGIEDVAVHPLRISFS
ncbi:MAG: putative transposase [Candidatus Izimaplasma bacterium HR2]|nr:MAG: putative transposase [Candidatus Izimaplasma bacterium HR2]